MLKQWTWKTWILQLEIQKAVSLTVDLHVEALWRHLKVAIGPCCLIVIDTKPL